MHIETIDWDALDARVEKPEGWADLTLREKQLYLVRFSETPALTAQRCSEMLGISRATCDKLWSRVRKKTGLDTLANPTSKLTAVTNGRVPQGEFLAKIEQAARLALDAMPKLIPKGDLKAVSGNFRDLMMMRNLILGEPTQIIGSSSRQTVNEVVEMLLREAKRRGIEIGTEPHSGAPVFKAIPRTIDAPRSREP